MAPGYKPVIRVLTLADATAQKPVLIQMKDRVVQLRVTPPDADVTLDGRVISARTTQLVEVRDGQVRQVEVKKTGFKAVQRTYANREGQPAPPEVDDIALNQRVVSVRVMPGGTQIDINGSKYGENFAEVTVPANGCTMVRASRPGYMPIEKQYCMREGIQPPPLDDQITLNDRMVEVIPEPETAEMWANGRRIGVGPQRVVVRQGQCVRVDVRANAFLPWRKEYCLGDNATTLPIDAELAKLPGDSLWAKSAESDQANVNFTISVNEKRTETDSWKILSQIVTNYFDVLELSDKETGYMRTGWNVASIPQTNRIVRTRVIVKQASASPLKYTVKLVSEHTYSANSVKDDEEFAPWTRILVRYKDVINEIQERLK